MTAQLVATGEIRTPAEIKRARILGVLYYLLAGFVLVVFGFGSDGTAVFELTRDADRFSGFPDLHVPALAFSWLVAFILVMLGTVQLLRGFGSKTNIVLAIVLLMFVVAFLAWAASGQSFSMVGMLEETVKRAVPITFGALAGVLSETVAVINIGIEACCSPARSPGCSLHHSGGLSPVSSARPSSEVCWRLRWRCWRSNTLWIRSLPAW